MPTTPTYGLRYPALTDTADVPRDVGNLATDVETQLRKTVMSTGTPAPNQVPVWNGTAWTYTSVSTAMLADGAVTNPKLAANSVDAAKIIDGTVGTAELANAAVSNAKLADGAVSLAKLANGVLPVATMSATTNGWGGDMNYRDIGGMNVGYNTHPSYMTPSGDGNIYFNAQGLYAIVATMKLALGSPHGPGYQCCCCLNASIGNLGGTMSYEQGSSPGGQNYNDGMGAMMFGLYNLGAGQWVRCGGWSTWSGAIYWNLYAVRLASPTAGSGLLAADAEVAAEPEQVEAKPKRRTRKKKEAA